MKAPLIAVGMLVAMGLEVASADDKSLTFKPSQTERIREVDINYETNIGNSSPGGLTLLLVHGFGASMQSWNDVIPLLSPHHALARLDLRGFGFSGHPRDNRYSLDEQAEIVAAFIDRLRLQRVVLVGHSYGGSVACSAFRKLRERTSGRVVGLVLIDSASYPQKLPSYVSNLRNPLTRFIANTFTTSTWRARYVLKRLFVDKSRIDRERVERYAFFMRVPGAEYSFGEVAEHLALPDAQEVSLTLKSIDVPTLIVWGEKDAAVPLEFARRLHQDVPGSSLEVLPDVGHVPHEERPRQTADVLLRFLSTLQ